MARRITFSKAEMAAVEYCVDNVYSHVPALKTLLTKMRQASLPVEMSGLGVEVYLRVGHSVLGDHLATPPVLTPGWRTKMTRRLRDSGLDEASARRLFEVVRDNWKPPYSAESIAFRSDTLLNPGYVGPGRRETRIAHGFTARPEFTGEE